MKIQYNNFLYRFLFVVSLIIGQYQSIAQSVADFPKPRHGNTYVIAHRGAHVGIPENSLAAFQKAIDLG